MPRSRSRSRERYRESHSHRDRHSDRSKSNRHKEVRRDDTRDRDRERYKGDRHGRHAEQFESGREDHQSRSGAALDRSVSVHVAGSAYGSQQAPGDTRSVAAGMAMHPAVGVKTTLVGKRVEPAQSACTLLQTCLNP